MSRAFRVEYEGALYHILSKGNEQQDIFFIDDNRVAFTIALGEMAEGFIERTCGNEKFCFIFYGRLVYIPISKSQTCLVLHILPLVDEYISQNQQFLSTM